MSEHHVNRAMYWERVYTAKPDTQTSWYQDEPTPSIDLIRAYARRGGRIIDVGGGSSIVAGRLAEAAFNVTVLDVSGAALERAQARAGEAAARINWIVADVTAADDLGRFDVWHDRAVFHFLTDDADRQRYLARAERSVEPGGHLIIGTFAPDGPEQCSGLPVQRYDDAALASAFAPAFSPVRALRHMHETPWGAAQPFQFVVLRRTPNARSASDAPA